MPKKCLKEKHTLKQLYLDPENCISYLYGVEEKETIYNKIIDNHLNTICSKAQIKYLFITDLEMRYPFL